ncbi:MULTISPECIES: hypothetical protein [Pseudomonas]|jgi:hypothetical protein|uniref:Uncharacterized protein n=1 Tax=Pseudomonas oryzihabitans TaxID=47885 RepID=A0A178LKF1_9PSED|nr:MULTISPECIES: hypothetical protein [Pseudomonas]MCD4865350.1 hypothetical protein [Pseudomonas sp. PLB05]MDC7829996.1 hypothetical protein [Pseudomonas benzopyrenica]MXS19406.1 hypothetical protein [Pseudomonas oryzihabitans]OAN31302.1 hypothetical protein A4V15_13195 [Pseudomonas oryzihabitans]UUW73414.1 hypothetical protein NRG74_08485 [Pseudomonas psychrotolerans]
MFEPNDLNRPPLDLARESRKAGGYGLLYSVLLAIGILLYHHWVPSAFPGSLLQMSLALPVILFAGSAVYYLTMVRKCERLQREEDEKTGKGKTRRR